MISLQKNYIFGFLFSCLQFAEGVILNMDEMWEESRTNVPLTCFLSMGSDPTENIMLLAKRKNFQCGAISMGQGQDVHARRLLSLSMQEGRWVLLQNCHLGLDFMDELLDLVRIFLNIILFDYYGLKEMHGTER